MTDQGPRHASGTAVPGLGGLTPSSHAGAHRARGRSRLRTGLLWSLPAAAVVALVTVLLVQAGTSEAPTDSDAPGGETPVAAAVTELVRWADAELRPDTPVLVPEDVLADVTAAGGDGERFRPLDAQAPGALVLLTEEPPEGSVVLARFSARDGSALTVADPTPGRPTADELDRRQRLSAAILANPNTGATARAAEVLKAAHVDARLLGLLAVLVAQLGVGVGDFPSAAGEPADGPLARAVLIDRVDGEPIPAGQEVTDRLLVFVDAQLTPFAPDSVEVTDDGVLIRYRYESAPDAVVTAETP